MMSGKERCNRCADSYAEKIAELSEHIGDLTQQLADSEAARNELTDKLMASNKRCAEAERERDALRADCERVINGKHKALAECAKAITQRDSALALARQAVEVLRTITDPTPITGGRCVLGNDQSRDEHAAQFYRGYNAGILAQWERFTKPATAFLARSDVVKLGGGK